MNKLFLGLLFVNLFTYCSGKSNTERKEKDLILGVWTDGSSPNASIRIENDSIYNVAYFEWSKYELTEDSLTIHYDDELFKAKIKKLDADSLIYVSEYGETKMWRFTD